jgi:phosphohistidine phosphatase
VKIYLMRHADAVSDEIDPARPLSMKGREQVAKVCEVLAKLGDFKPVEIWHSPLARSRETADLLDVGLKLNVPLFLKPGLTPDDDPANIADILGSETREIVIVGHEPHLGVLASMMVHGPSRPGVYYPFSKAGIVALTREGKAWRSKWIVRSP